MICPSCGTEPLDEAGRCKACGMDFPLTCATCGTPNLRGARYCNACGKPLDRSAVQAERKVVTVLFADIVGSTELIGENDPERALSHLQPALARMGEAANRFHGAVLRTMGDGIMVLFGVPRIQEDHALLACRAALAMQQASLKAGLVLRIGLHSGEVVTGLMLHLTKEQSAYGAAIHLASRLEHLAQAGEICLTEATFRLVRPFCDAALIGAQEMKGFAQPVPVYRLIRLKSAGTSEQFGHAQLAAYRGRAAELQRLEQAQEAAGTGHGNVVGICGAPGLGKSRLCFEFVERCRERGIPVLETRASPYDYSGPLQPLLEFLRAFFHLQPEDDAATARARIRKRMEAISPALLDDFAVFADILGVSDPREPKPKLDPKAKQARLVRAIAHLVREGGRLPSVILIEDIHWLDEGSQAIITGLVEAVAQTRVLLLLTYRTNFVPAWKGVPHVDELHLSELSQQDVASLVAEAVGNHPRVQTIRDRIVERSGGNPFFAEELVRALADHGALVAESGRAGGDSQSIAGALPATVQGVIGARIDRLRDIDKTVLQIGATVGREFPFTVLEEVSNLPRVQLEESLDRLCDLELLRNVVGGDGLAFYAFRHPLIQEVAYAMQLTSRRAALHGAVARAIEHFHHNRLDEYACLIASHFEAAGDVAAAVKYLARGALWIGTTDSREALKAWRKVHALLEGLPRTTDSDELRMMSSGQIVTLGWREGLTAHEAAPFAQQALGIARDNGNTLAEMLLLAGYGRILAASGSADAYVEHVQRAYAMSTPDNLSHRALLQALLCQGYGLAGKLREALAANTAALDDIAHIEKFHEQLLGFNVERWVRSLRGRILVRIGDFAAARASLGQLVAGEAEHPDPAVQFIPHLAFVELAWLTSDVELAAIHSERIDDIGRKSEIPYLAVYANACKGMACVLAGQHAEAESRLRSALELAREGRAAAEYEPEVLAILAETYRRDNCFDVAADVADTAIDVARARGARLAECRATITLAALAANTAAGQADEWRRRTEELIAETGAEAYRALLDAAMPGNATATPSPEA